MGIISNLFSKPREYDNNWQIETINIVINGTEYNWIVPFESNIKILSLHIYARTAAGIRSTTDHFRIDFFDGGRKMFQSIPYSVSSSLTYYITWQTGISLPTTTTPVDARFVSLPDILYLTPGQRLNLLMNNPLIGDIIYYMNITYQRWKL